MIINNLPFYKTASTFLSLLNFNQNKNFF